MVKENAPEISSWEENAYPLFLKKQLEKHGTLMETIFLNLMRSPLMGNGLLSRELTEELRSNLEEKGFGPHFDKGSLEELSRAQEDPLIPEIAFWVNYQKNREGCMTAHIGLPVAIFPCVRLARNSIPLTSPFPAIPRALEESICFPAFTISEKGGDLIPGVQYIYCPGPDEASNKEPRLEMVFCDYEGRYLNRCSTRDLNGSYPNENPPVAYIASANDLQCSI